MRDCGDAISVSFADFCGFKTRKQIAYSSAMADDDKEEARRRYAYEEEEEAARADEEYRAKLAEETEAAEREAAIEEMVEWFEEHFEDPQNETPRNSEEGVYVYLWGGPFDAREMLEDQFHDIYKEEWVESATEQVQASGTFEWAPTTHGDFYEHPERDGDDATDSTEASDTVETIRAELTGRIVAKLDELDARLAELPAVPASIGHNYPPDDIGLPPYNDDSRRDLEEAAVIARQEAIEAVPDEAKLGQVESTFRRIGTAIMHWIGRKLDLAVDETIKATVKAAAWGTVATLALGLADDIGALLRHLLLF